MNITQDNLDIFTGSHVEVSISTDAWNDPTNVTTGQKIAAAALAVSQNMGNIANIKSTNVSGMAHDGIDNIPREGTWLLDKGERVVDQRTNGDLKDFLSAQKSGGGNSQPIEVNAPLPAILNHGLIRLI